MSLSLEGVLFYFFFLFFFFFSFLCSCFTLKFDVSPDAYHIIEVWCPTFSSLLEGDMGRSELIHISNGAYICVCFFVANSRVCDC